MRVIGVHCEEISIMGRDIHRLFNLGGRFDPIEITFDTEWFVQPSSILQVQFAWVMNFDPNFQMRWFPSLSVGLIWVERG